MNRGELRDLIVTVRCDGRSSDSIYVNLLMEEFAKIWDEGYEEVRIDQTEPIMSYLNVAEKGEYALPDLAD